MQNTFEEIREQIHEIRNMLGPVELKLDNLDHKIVASRISSEAIASDLEARIAADSLRISEQWNKISEHSDELVRQSERIRQIELFLKIPAGFEKPASGPTPVHVDKSDPKVVPPQKPSK